jgi:hypothetical protein
MIEAVASVVFVAFAVTRAFSRVSRLKLRVVDGSQRPVEGQKIGGFGR